jgi:hypothetical protein
MRSAPVRAGAKAAGEAAARVVEHLTYLDAPREELVAGRVHVVHRHEQAVDRARLIGGDPLKKMIEAPDPGGVICTMR